MTSTRQELTVLRNLISEADLILATTELPQGRAIRCRELLRSAMAVADDLVAHARVPTAALGRKGGSVTAGKGGMSAGAKLGHSAPRERRSAAE